MFGEDFAAEEEQEEENAMQSEMVFTLEDLNKLAGSTYGQAAESHPHASRTMED